MKTLITYENKMNDYYNNRICNNLESEKFIEIVSVKQDILVDNKSTHIVYTFYIPKSNFKDPIMSLVVEGNYNESTFNRVLDFECELCYQEKYLCPHLIYMIDKINNHQVANILYDDDLIVGIDNKIKEFRKKELVQQRKMVNEKLDQVLMQIQKQEDILPIKDVQLEPMIKIENNDLYLSLKIGKGKKYVVKKIDELLANISQKETVSYSKTFTFNHNYNSFDNKSRELIQLLVSLYRVYLTRDNRFLCATPSFVDRIVQIYHNDYINITYKDNSYRLFITDEPFDLKMKIKGNYLLFENDVSTFFILEGYVNNYVGYNGFLYTLSGTQELRALQKFLFNEKKFDFSLIQKRFAKEIYSRFYDVISADEDYKKQNPLKELKIQAYFNYENDEIILDSKYYLDSKETSITQANEFSYLSKKLVKYNSIIDNIGFKDNKLTTIEEVSSFLKADLTELKKYADVFLSETLTKMQIKKFTKPTAKLSYKTGMLDIAFADLKYSQEELKAIINGLKKKVKYVKLKDNTILEIDKNDGEKFLSTIEEFDLNTNKLQETQSKPLYQSLKMIGDVDSLVNIETDSYLKQMINDIKNYKNSEYDVDDSLKKVMRDYQIEAYKWIKTLIKYGFSGVIADDMGLGKTLEIISVIKGDTTTLPSLIVCPKSLVYNWVNEFKKWSPNDQVQAIDGININRKAIIETIDSKKKVIYITSYDSLRNDLDYYQNLMFRYMILDEAQYIKNHNTLKAQSVKQVNAVNRFVLTGTPIENSVLDLWSIFDFLMPSYLYKFKDFKSKYERNIVDKDTETINSLIKKITPFVLRRTKEKVLKSLPKKVENIYYAKMGDDQRKIYESELLKTREVIKSSQSKIDILACLTRLRQACVDPALYVDGYQGSSCKNEMLKELVDKFILEGHKLLIFSQFTSSFVKIEKMLQDLDINYCVLTGQTPAQERMQMATAFNEDENIKVFLCSLKAGGTGLNLVGADIVIHLDPWWNVAAENQATDRAHRIGQKNVVQVIKIICQDSIEQKVIELQSIKKDIADTLISADDKIEKLTDKDLKYLLS